MSTSVVGAPTQQRILSNREAEALMKAQKAKALKECKAQMEGVLSTPFHNRITRINRCIVQLLTCENHDAS